MTTAKSNVVGIDLGTTYSAIATLDDQGQPVTLPNQEGEMLTPSAILLEGNLAVVGQAAHDVAMEQPENVAQLIKRYMGNAKFAHPIAGRDIRPETLSAILLKRLVQDAEKRIGPVQQCVITVPAYYDDTRRKATQDAGRIAGLEVLDIIDEPTAAALAYSFQPSHGTNPPGFLPQNQTVLVYDLGGGTFDVTLVKLSEKRFESLGVEGDVRLGGQDWDDRIIDFVAAKFKAEHGQDPKSDPRSLAALDQAAERAKRTLSKLPKTAITCTHAGKMMTVSLTRQEFESITADLLMRTRLTTQQVLRDAKKEWNEVDRVLLVGGSTHMPMTANMLKSISGKEPDNSLAVREVVARGAALHAGIVSARRAATRASLPPSLRSALGEVVEINVNSHSLGIEVRKKDDRVNDVLVPKNTQLPTAASRVYRTAVDNQPHVRVRVLQGDAQQADDCISIGECWIEGLPATLPKGSPIQVRCGVGSNGMIDIMALDMTSGAMARAEIHRSSGLSDEDIAKEAEWVRSLEIQ